VEASHHAERTSLALSPEACPPLKPAMYSSGSADNYQLNTVLK
jgi:hypothetical protein